MADNGSLMRLAPVAMFYALRPEEAIQACGESSRTTHGARDAVNACRYFGGLLIVAMNGVSKAELLAPMYSPVPGLWEMAPLAPKIEKVGGGSFARRSPPEIRGTGYVVESLEAALWAFATTDNYRDGCLAAVNLGDDADTTAAIYGQIAGAYYGASGIPGEWRKRLALSDLIARTCDSLFEKGFRHGETGLPAEPLRDRLTRGPRGGDGSLTSARSPTRRQARGAA